MNANNDKRLRHLLAVLAAIVVLALSAACAAPPTPAATPAAPTTAPAQPTMTSAPPTATPVPPTATLAPPTATRVPPTATPAPPTATPVPALKDVAAKISDNMGKVVKVVEGDPKRVVYFFEERHDSILGQMEIAAMVNRLYEKHGLKHIGLEGRTVEEGPLNLSWAHVKPYYQPGQKITNREDVIATTLATGEIGSAEFMGLIYADVVVDGIDDAKLYASQLTADMNNAPISYLLLIATTRMNDSQRSILAALLTAKKENDAVNFALSSDRFAADTFARMRDVVNFASLEEHLDLLDKIEQEGQKVGIKPSAKVQADFQKMRAWLKDGTQRSAAMVANMLKVLAANPGAPVAMSVGAGHTARIVELLTKEGVSVAVIQPRSLADASSLGMLSKEAYARKEKGQSVAPAGYLGALLEGRKKPKPTAEDKKYQQGTKLRQKIQTLVWEAENMNKTGWSLEEIERAINDFALSDVSDIAGVDRMRVVQAEHNMSGGITLAVTIVFKPGEGPDMPVRGVAEIKRDSAGKPSVSLQTMLEDRISVMRKEVPTKPVAQPVPGTAADPKVENICSDTQVTWGVGG